MCRLFGMSAGRRRVRASFWLLDAPDSLMVQSRREPDGTGLGYFDAGGHPVVDKQATAAYDDASFSSSAREVEASTFVAHVRMASTGAIRPENTHPFEQNERIFAQNGVIEDMATLEAELGDYRDLVAGDTDSERFFALVTKEIEARGGDVGAGIAAAARFAANRLPLLSINLVLIAGGDLWALRYPQTHDLLVCRRAGGVDKLDEVTSTGARISSEDLAGAESVIVATERIDESADWRELASGELLHVDSALNLSTAIVVGEPPAHLLTLADLNPRAAASQGSSAKPTNPRGAG
ncbi:MAG: class II glutamine amidotransferase [Thermoleophilaceae bacterium]